MKRLYQRLWGLREPAAPAAPRVAPPGPKVCTHLDLVQEVTPSAQGCEECLALGDTWLHLRICLICGHVGCCNSSKNKHATAHYHATGHPLMQSFQPGEDWVWCFEDQILVDLPRAQKVGR